MSSRKTRGRHWPKSSCPPARTQRDRYSRSSLLTNPPRRGSARNCRRAGQREPASALTIYSKHRIYASMKIKSMMAAADEASDLLKALANRHRLIIICQLIEKERSVGELAELLQIRDSTVSQHLALLRKDGLVTARRDGQTIWYSIGSPQARELVQTLYRVYCSPASARERKAGRKKPGAERRRA